MTIVFISKVKKIYIWLFWFHSFLVFFEIDIEVNRCLWETRLWELRTEYFPMSITSYSKSIPPPRIYNASDECGVGTDAPQMGFPEMELMSCGNPGELVPCASWVPALHLYSLIMLGEGGWLFPSHESTPLRC